MPFPPPNPTTNPAPDNTRHVVIEPVKPAPPLLKQYFSLHNLKIDAKTSVKTFQQIQLTEAIALPFVSAHLMLPLDVAIREGLYPPRTESAPVQIAEKVKHTLKEIINLPDEDTSPPKLTTTPILGNKLREEVQLKKVQTAKLDPTKLAAIKAGGHK